MSARLKYQTALTLNWLEQLEWEKKIMLWSVAIILIVLWLIGVLTSYTMSGLIHLLLVVGIIMILVRIFQGRHLS